MSLVRIKCDDCSVDRVFSSVKPIIQCPYCGSSSISASRASRASPKEPISAKTVFITVLITVVFLLFVFAGAEVSSPETPEEKEAARKKAQRIFAENERKQEEKRQRIDQFNKIELAKIRDLSVEREAEEAERISREEYRNSTWSSRTILSVERLGGYSVDEKYQVQQNSVTPMIGVSGGRRIYGVAPTTNQIEKTRKKWVPTKYRVEYRTNGGPVKIVTIDYDPSSYAR